MKYFISFFVFSFISIFIFYSCKTDFDVNAKWKDITVVYGLLNQNDSLHLIKVNKAFLGSEDAYIMAKHSDSINYSNASVSLEQWKNNSLVKTIILNPTTQENLGYEKLHLQSGHTQGTSQPLPLSRTQ